MGAGRSKPSVQSRQKGGGGGGVDELPPTLSLNTIVASSGFDVDTLGGYSHGVATSLEVQHYMSPLFPICSRIKPEYIKECNNTWEVIQSGNSDRMMEYNKPGIVLFYDEYYFRLFQRDTTFEDVFSDAKKRGSVLIKIVSRLLSLKTQDSIDSNEGNINQLRFLGHKHRSFTFVKPHHFATLSQVLVEVIMYWLGESASPSATEAWCNVLGFSLRYMLEAFLYNHVDPYECYQNTLIGAVREIKNSSNENSLIRTLNDSNYNQEEERSTTLKSPNMYE